MQRISLIRWAVRLLALLLITATLTIPGRSHAAPPSPMLAEIMPAPDRHQHEGVQITSRGTIHLSNDAAAPPFPETYQHYGAALSEAYHLFFPTNRVMLVYDATEPAGSEVHIDLRGSSDGTRWTEWHTGHASGTVVEFAQPVQVIQYRARIFARGSADPAVQSVRVQPLDSTADYAVLEELPVAPTYKIRATRLGMVGGRTANGHIITRNDRFVALPSWRSLNSHGGHEYSVRITYQGRSVVAPVWDVGPWNTRDNYWSSNRERYSDLPQGWPQDHAAYYDNYNGGYAEKGYVRFPTAMDVGDGLWYELGIDGDQGSVEVTYLWLGRDPLVTPPPPPDPNASEFRVTEAMEGYTFQSSAARAWYHSPTGCGEGGHALRTLSVTDPAKQENEARWQPQLPLEAEYDVYVHVPLCPADQPVTQHARYQVRHRDGETTVEVNQAQQTGWVLLGRYPFAASSDGFVRLTDVAGDHGNTMWFDDAKWVPVRGETNTPAEPTATPTAQPTATPTPTTEPEREPTAVPTAVPTATPLASRSHVVQPESSTIPTAGALSSSGTLVSTATPQPTATPQALPSEGKVVSSTLESEHTTTP